MSKPVKRTNPAFDTLNDLLEKTDFTRSPYRGTYAVIARRLKVTNEGIRIAVRRGNMRIIRLVAAEVARRDAEVNQSIADIGGSV